MKMLLPLRHLVACAALSAAAPLAHSSLVYETSFTGNVSPFETAQGYEDWHVQRSAVSVSTSLALNGDGKLLINNPADGSASSLFGGAIYRGNTSISDGSVSGVFQYVANGNQSSGLLARVQNPNADGSRPLGYFAGLLRYNAGAGNQTFLVIAKDVEFANVSNSLIASKVVSVTSMNYYRLNFSFEGDELTAVLYNEAGDTQINSLSVTDSAYSSGATGLRANFGTTNRTIGFDSFQVTAIPEPSTALLLFPAGLFAIQFLRKNR